MDRPRHLIGAADVDRRLLDDLFVLARDLEEVVRSRGGTDDLRGRVLATLFYEPSTRTRFSFEVAMLRLGGSVIGAENAREHSSGAKGETLEDTTRIVGGYVDGLRIALVGDLANGRTVHSLCRMAPLYRGVELYLVSPEATRMRPDVLEF